MTETLWPSSIRASARSLMCCCTPPGTSQEYGQAMPIRMGGSRVSRGGTARGGEAGLGPGRGRGRRGAVAFHGAGAAGGEPLWLQVVDEDLLQHVPVFRVLADP